MVNPSTRTGDTGHNRGCPASSTVASIGNFARRIVSRASAGASLGEITAGGGMREGQARGAKVSRKKRAEPARENRADFSFEPGRGALGVHFRLRQWSAVSPSSSGALL